MTKITAVKTEDKNKPSSSDSPAPKTVAEPSANETSTMTWYEAFANGTAEDAQKAVSKHLLKIINRHELGDYKILLLFDDVDSISNFHSDQLYAAASSDRDQPQDILLILHSSGGSIEPAYLISKALKRLSKQKFLVAVPRRAKSAATLLALGADEIHMGMMSQLGPIDPQSGGLPVLAVGNAFDTIVDLACRFPAASSLLTKYLEDQVPIRLLGYYRRVGESAVQYAERLLAGKELGAEKTAEDVAKHLVNHYKDHGFVIDSDEAKTLLGGKLIKEGTKEYGLADDIFRFLDLASMIAHIHDKQIWHVGSVETGFSIKSIPKDKK